VTEVARMLKAIYAQEDRSAAEAKSKEIIARLRAMNADLREGSVCGASASSVVFGSWLLMTSPKVHPIFTTENGRSH